MGFLTANIERLARAARSGNLLMVDHELGDIDRIAASGLSQVKFRLGGLAFWSKYAQDGHKAREFVAYLERLTYSRSKMRRWRLTREEAKLLSDTLALYWLDDTCPHCKGRGFVPRMVRNLLHETTCKPCDGSGRKPMPQKPNDDWERDRFERQFSELERFVEEALEDYVRLTSRKLRNPLD